MLKSKPPIYIGNLRQCFNPCLCVTCPQTIAFDLLFTPPGHRARVLRAGRLGRPQRRAGLVKTIEKVEFPILVFVELALEALRRILPPFETPGFNPCFRGTCPRRAGLSSKITSPPGSFNPCFRGTCPRRYHALFRWSPHICVSILVFVEFALEAILTFPRASSTCVFQSLFSWNLPSKFHRSSKTGSPPITRCFSQEPLTSS